MSFIISNHNKEEVDAIAKELDLPNFIVEILFSKGLKKIEDILDFLVVEEDNLSPPTLPDQIIACERIVEAIKKQEQITICGDYDVDGTLATVILLRFLKKAGAKVNYFIPHRTLDGYGLSVELMENLYPETKLLISVDTGTTAHEPAKRAKELGIDIIVTDHHNLDPRGDPPVYALINPKKTKDENLQQLAGAGIAYYLVRALNLFFEKIKMPNIEEDEFQVLAMIATIADVVPLSKDNRIIVNFGLKKLPYIKIPGMLSVLQQLKISNPTAKDIGWRISPLINAAGRIGSAQTVLDLLIEEDEMTSLVKAQELMDINKKRKKISDTTTEEVLKSLEGEDLSQKNIIVVAGDYHVGVIGITAARIVNKYHKPAIVIGWDGEEGKASCRSIEGISIKEVVDLTSDYHLGGGGHDMAAGFSIRRDQFDKFKEKAEESLKEKTISEKKIFVDTVIDIDDIRSNSPKEDLKKIRATMLLEPTGKGNEVPVVKMTNIPISAIREMRGGHLLITSTEKLKLVYFNPPELFLKKNDIITVIGNLTVEYEQWKLEIIKIL